MPSSNERLGQASTADTPSMDVTSDIEIIEIGDSPVKRVDPPESSRQKIQKRKPLASHKADLQVAPMFTQMAASCSTSTGAGTSLKRKRDSIEESPRPTSTSLQDSNKQSASFTGPSPVSKVVRVDPLKAVQP